MLLLNKTQEEYNFTAFNAMVGLDVIGVKRLKSKNVMLQADHTCILDHQIFSKGYVNNKPVFQMILIIKHFFLSAVFHLNAVSRTISVTG